MGKVIIHNKSDLTDFQALNMVLVVMQKGRISNQGKEYCAAMSFKWN